jgi:hypothetical protein
MQHGEVSRAKRGRPLSQNEIWEIVIVSVSDGAGGYLRMWYGGEITPTFATVFLFKAPYKPRFFRQQL